MHLQLFFSRIGVKRKWWLLQCCECSSWLDSVNFSIWWSFHLVRGSDY